MPIIYIKNPRSGSHFRHLGPGTKGGRPMRGIQKSKMLRMQKSIRSVGWASCNSAYQNFIRWGKGGGSFGGQMRPVAWTLWQMLTSSGPTATIIGQRQRRPGTDGVQFSTFSKPCR